MATLDASRWRPLPVQPARSAILSITSHPMLWRVPAYWDPGLPRPTTTFKRPSADSTTGPDPDAGGPGAMVSATARTGLRLARGGRQAAFGCPAAGHQSVRRVEVDVDRNDADLAIREAGDERPVRTDDPRDRPLRRPGSVGGSDVDAVLEGADEQRLLVVRIPRIAPQARQGAVVRDDVVRDEHDLGASQHESSGDLRIAIGLVTDGDAERDTGRREGPPPGARDVPPLLRGIDLRLDLLANTRPIRTEHDRQDLEPGGGRPFGTDDRDDPDPTGCGPDDSERLLQRVGADLGDWVRLIAVSRQRRLGQADDPGAEACRLLDGSDGRGYGVVQRRGQRRRGDRDADRGHGAESSPSGPRSRATGARGRASRLPRPAPHGPNRRCGGRRASRASASRPPATRRRHSSARRDPRWPARRPARRR